MGGRLYMDDVVSWSQTDEDGTVTITRAFNKLGGTGAAGSSLSQDACVALALSEKCCVNGEGMVYTLPRHPAVMCPKGATVADHAAFLALPGPVMKRLPTHFYLPEKWSPARQQAWSGMTATHRLDRLTERRGWLADGVPVLPFHLEVITASTTRALRFSGLTEAELTVIINSNVYVVPTRKLRDLCERDVELTAQGATYDTSMVVKSASAWTDLDKWRVDGLEGAIQRLDEIFWDGDRMAEGRLTDVASLDKLIRETAREAAAGRDMTESGQSTG